MNAEAPGMDDVASAPDDEAGASEADHEVLEFGVSGDRFAVDVDELVSIDEDVALTRLPRSPPAIVGITDMRGDVTAVLEPGSVLGVDAEGTRRYLLVTEGRGERQKIGLLVDDVERVRAYDDEDVDVRDDLDEFASPGLENDVVRGVIRDERDGDVALVGLLSFDEIVARAEEGAGA